MATQRESLGFTTAQIDLNDGLIAGEKYRTEWSVVIAQGQPALKRGQILIGPETGAAPYVGAGTIIGVLAIDTPATTSGTHNAFMYVEGELNEDKLVGLDTAGRTALRALGIFPKRVD
jgi:hypothetical protein